VVEEVSVPTEAMKVLAEAVSASGVQALKVPVEL
jgi:hypothetical protein